MVDKNSKSSSAKIANSAADVAPPMIPAPVARLGAAAKKSHSVKTSTARRIAREADSAAAEQATGTLPGFPAPGTEEPAVAKASSAVSAARNKVEKGQLDSEAAAFFALSADELPKLMPLDETIQIELFTIVNGASDWAIKDDISSMEYPIYTLAKKPSMKIRTFSRGRNTLKIIPSGYGAPTIFDKDLVIYTVSKIVEAINAGLPFSRRIRFEVTPFLRGTRRNMSGLSYQRVVETCRRLRGTTIETNIRTTEEERTNGFGLFESYTVLNQTSNGKGALILEVTISEWLYRAASELQVLTLNPAYFSLSQALERRVYELARKHCGDQPWWVINLDLLYEKMGSEATPRRFRQDLKSMIEDSDIPDYRLGLDESERGNPKLVIFTKDNGKLMAAANAANKVNWIAHFIKEASARKTKR